MNRPTEPIFATRLTITIELPLGKNTRLLHPELVILKIGHNSHAIGALCYSLRSSKMRKSGQPREVVIGSLLKQRPKEILQLIKALSRLVVDNGKSLITVGNYAHQLKSFLDWSDSNGLHDCLSGGEATRNAYRAWVTETRERYLRQEFGQRAHNNRLDFSANFLKPRLVLKRSAAAWARSRKPGTRMAAPNPWYRTTWRMAWRSTRRCSTACAT